MFIHTRGPWRRGAPTYGCMAYHTRGRVVCPNNLEAPLEATDHAVLKAVEHDLLRVEVLETALAKTLDMMHRDGSGSGANASGSARNSPASTRRTAAWPEPFPRAASWRRSSSRCRNASAAVRRCGLNWRRWSEPPKALAGSTSPVCSMRCGVSSPTGRVCFVRKEQRRVARCQPSSPGASSSLRRARAGRGTTNSPVPERSARLSRAFLNEDGAPGVNRTPGPGFRKPLLYPTELRGPASGYHDSAGGLFGVPPGSSRWTRARLVQCPRSSGPTYR